MLLTIMAVIQEYFDYTTKLKQEYGDKSIVLMQVGSFYEIYGVKPQNSTEYILSNISQVSIICELKIAHKQATFQQCNVVCAGFPVYNIDKFIKKLQDAQYTTAVYIQDENITGTSRSLEGIYSPGTWFNHDSQRLTNSISCVWLHKCKQNIIIGMSNIDIITGSFILYEYQELHKNESFDQIERFLSIHDPHEIIFIHNDAHKIIHKVQQFSNSQQKYCHFLDLNDSTNPNAERAFKCEKQTYQSEIISRFLSNFDLSSHYFQYAIAIQASVFLIDWIWRHNPNLIKNLQSPIFENYSNNVILANHSLKQLNIINDNNVISNSKTSSISNFVNSCVTAMGKRKTYDMIVHPTFCPETLNDIYYITSYILEKDDLYHTRANMKDIKDFDKFITKLHIGQIHPIDLFNLYNDFNSVLILHDIIKRDKKLKHFFEHIEDFVFHDITNKLDELISYIKTVLDIEICSNIYSLDTDINFIKHGFNVDHDKHQTNVINNDVDLTKIKTYLSNLLSKFETKKKSETKKSEFVTIHKTDKHGYNIITTKRRSTILQNEINNIKSSDLYLYSISEYFQIHQITMLQGSTASNQHICSSQIKTVCNKMVTDKELLILSQTAIFKSMCEELISHSNSIKEISKFVTHIDYIINNAYIAKQNNYCKPVVTKSEHSFVKATGIRHPLIENILKDELYVTNDISFDSIDNIGYLLYGTNAVGKSSFIKSIGISIIMAQAGFFVPCQSFEFFPFQKIFTRILGNDNLFQGLSTFAVEMLEFKNILQQCCEHSIILGDELCSGTETDSAISIILAGINHLYKRQSKFIFATHFHEIVNYEEIASKSKLHIKHMSIMYDNEKDKLIYNRKLINGSGDSMYGLEVCKSLHLPRPFLTNAHEIRNKYNKRYESILDYKSSSYNSNKLKGGLCEFCNKRPTTDVHHMQYQESANSNGFIDSTFNKNHVANLLNVCFECHKKIHQLQIKMKKIKTTSGVELTTI